MNDDYSQSFRVLDAVEPAELSVEVDVSRIRAVGMNSAEYIHQSRLSSSVFTNNRVDFSLVNGDVHIVEGFNTRKLLGD